MDQILEEWRSVPDYEGLYEVSNLGRVRSVDGIRWNGQRHHAFKGRVLKQNGRPYLHVVLSKNKKLSTKRVHVLVASAFLDPCPGTRGRTRHDYHIDHVNGDKLDNRVANLRWLLHVENTMIFNPNSVCKRKGASHPNAKLTEDLVLAIRSSSLSASEVSRLYGVKQDYVYQIRNRTAWRHI